MAPKKHNPEEIARNERRRLTSSYPGNALSCCAAFGGSFATQICNQLHKITR